MRLHILPFTALLLLSPSPARAQVRLGISIGLPVAPRMEIIAPGIQVVTGFEEEVFLQGGWYWARRSDGWYRSRNGRGSFDYVESRRVPRGLVRMPQGHYRNWHHEGWDRGENRGQRMQEERHDERGRKNEGGHGHHQPTLKATLALVQELRFRQAALELILAHPRVTLLSKPCSFDDLRMRLKAVSDDHEN